MYHLFTALAQSRNTNTIAVSLAVLLAIQVAHTAGAHATEPATPPNRITLTFRFGATDTESTSWDGTLRCPPGVTIEKAEFLGFYPKHDGGLELDSPQRLSWRGRSKCEVMQEYFKKQPVTDPQGDPIRYPLQPYTFAVELASESWQPITVKMTDHGDFKFNPTSVPYGQPARFLGGSVEVERSLSTTDLGSNHGPNDAILYNDFPALCATPDGSVFTAFVSYQGRPQSRVSLKKDPENFAPLKQPTCNDRLLVVREHNGMVDKPMAVTEGGLDLLCPTIVCAPKRGPVVVWSQRSGQNWDLYASVLDGGTWCAPARLTATAGPDIYPALAPAPSGCWVAWQTYREGTFRIALAELDLESLKFKKEVDLTDGRANCWMPAIAASEKGTIAVAYDTYEKGDYDVYCALCPGGAPADSHVPIATSLRFEARSTLAYDSQHRLWIAWEETGEHWGKDCGRFGPEAKQIGELIDDGRTIGLACLENGSLRKCAAPTDSLFPLQQMVFNVYGKPVRPRASVFGDKARYAYYPKLGTTATGQLYLAFRQHDYLPEMALAHQTIWSSYVAMADGDRWLHPVRVSGSDGHRHGAPSICALPDGGVAVAIAGDRRASLPRAKADYSQNVRLGRLIPSNTSSRPALGQAIDASPSEVPASVAEEREAVRHMRDYRATVAGKTYRILRGDFHRHTAFSSDSAHGDGCIEDAFRYALDAASLDTMGNGDHDNGSGLEYPWYLTQKFYDVYLLADHFVPMFSYERSVTANGPQGHRNIIMPHRGVRVLPVFGKDNIDERGSIQDTRLLFQFLREYKFVSIPHTIATGAGPNFVDYAPDVDCVVEIYQGARNAYEYPNCPRGIAKGNDAGFYWSLLKAGKKYGVISSSDHRSTHMSYAMLYLPEMSREAVMDAFRSRHCYAATDNILLDVRIGSEAMMGDEVTVQSAPEFQIHVVGTAPIQTLEIIRNAEVYHSISPESDTVDLRWTDPAPLASETSYYVRVSQKDGELAWGTPLWVHQE